MDLGLAGRHVLVAGASRGLGFAIVSNLLAEGAKVTSVGRDPESLAVARAFWLTGEPKAIVNTLSLDLSDQASAATLATYLTDEGGLDGVIVVAGSGRPTGEPQTTAFATATALNVMPALVTLEAAGPLLRKSSSGSVVPTWHGLPGGSPARSGSRPRSMRPAAAMTSTSSSNRSGTSSRWPN